MRAARLLTAPFRALVRVWAEPLPAEPLALFRISLGAVILCSILSSTLPRLPRDLGGDPLAPAEALADWPRSTGRWSVLIGPPRTPLAEDWYYKERGDERVDARRAWDTYYRDAPWARDWADWGRRPHNAYLLCALWASSALLVTVGLFTRVAQVALWALTVSFHTRLTWLLNGGDSLYCCALFYLMFCRSGAAWSLDAVLAGRRATVPAWPIRLLQLQIALVYFFTGVCKVTNGFPSEPPTLYDTCKQWDLTHWGTFWTGLSDFTSVFWSKAKEQDFLNGEAVYWVLNDTALNRFPYWALPLPLWLCRLLSWGTLAFEIGFPFFVVWRRLRPYVLIVGTAFHLGIWLHTEVGYFSFVSVCYYALFLTGPAAAYLLALPGRLVRRPPRAGPDEGPEDVAVEQVA